MHSRGIIAVTLAAALSVPAASLAQEHAAVPAYPTAAYPITSEGNRAAAESYKLLYRHHRREYRRQRHLERHLGGAVLVVAPVPFLPVPVLAPIPVAAQVVNVPVPVIVPQPVYPVVLAPAAPAPVARAEQVEDLSRTILGASIQAHPDGAVVGAALFTEGKRLGLHLGANGILARTDDESRLETLKLVEAHLTWAPITGARGRVRVEGGVSAAFAPESNSVGPDFGLSGDVRVIGSLGIQAAARYAPFPHKRVETSAGLFLGLGPLRVEGGWRGMWLDARVLDGLQTVDCLRGPYLGASLVF